MSIFSRLAKNIKRGLRTIAPIAAPILGAALPGVGGIIASTIGGAITQRPAAATPPIRVLPGGGAVRHPVQVPIKRVTPGAIAARQRAQLTAGRTVVNVPGGTGFTRPTTAGVAGMSLLSRLPAIGSRIGQVLSRPGVQLGGTAAAIGAGLVLGPDGQPVRKRRRMNFGNAKAARRAIRRIKGTRKLLQDIEKQLPRRTVRSRAKTHHHHPAAGG
jgi:hypothetical protein